MLPWVPYITLPMPVIRKLKGDQNMDERFIALEKERRLYIMLYFGGLIIEVAGLIGMLKGKPAPGIAVALTGLALWCAGGIWGKHRYQDHCAQTVAIFSLHVEESVFPDKKTADACFPLEKLIPPSRKTGTALHMHPVIGKLFGKKVFISECTLPYFSHQEEKKPRFLIGTLITACTSFRYSVTALCGQPFGGTVLKEDFAAWQEIETGGQDYHAFLTDGSSAAVITDDQSRILEEFGTIAEHGAIISCSTDRIAVFLPLRFYSGHYTLNTPLKPSDLDKSPFPEMEKLSELFSEFSPD